MMYVLVLSPEVALRTALTSWLRFSLPTGQVGAASTFNDGHAVSRGNQVEAVVVDGRLLSDATRDDWLKLRQALPGARWIAIHDDQASVTTLSGIDADVRRSRLFADLVTALRATPPPA
jgi:hypothetical protein